MSPELLRLLEACKEAPDDRAPRLVLADWLEEHGEAERAELVRLTVALTGPGPLAEDEPDHALRQARLAEVQRGKRGRSWLAPLGRLKKHVRWRVGLGCVLQLAPGDANALVKALPDDLRPWLETVNLHQAWSADELRRFAPALSLFRAMSLTSCPAPKG